MSQTQNNSNESLQLFEDQAIRTAWDEDKEEWYFSIVDVIAIKWYNHYWKSGLSVPQKLNRVLM